MNIIFGVIVAVTSYNGENEHMSKYLKGKDIKVPFDCLWHCYTRKFEVFLTGNQLDSAHAIGARKFKVQEYNKPEEFEKW